MDWISELPEDILLKILCLLPTQDVVATMVLSNRWQFVWTLVPRLKYDESYKTNGSFSRFIDRSLLLHKAPVLETLHFKFVGESSAEGIGVWPLAKRCVRELIIEIDCSSRGNPPTLPRSLYTACRMLVTLKLNNVILVDCSAPISFPSLKTLSLFSVKYPGDEFVKRFLSNCHVLEDLHVVICRDDNVTIFTVIVPSLKSLVLHTFDDDDDDDDDKDEEDGFVINAPSLECLDIVDYWTEGFFIIENDMPKILSSRFEINYSHLGKILGCVASVKRLNLCLPTSQYSYPVGCVFHRLEHLEICTCETEWLDLLMCLLRGSPNLQALKLQQTHSHRDYEPRPCWKEPSSVPKCLISSLKTLEWRQYEGTKEEEDLLEYILRRGSSLKKATISCLENSYKKCLMNDKLSWWNKLSYLSRRA